MKRPCGGTLLDKDTIAVGNRLEETGTVDYLNGLAPGRKILITGEKGLKKNNSPV